MHIEVLYTQLWTWWIEEEEEERKMQNRGTKRRSFSRRRRTRTKKGNITIALFNPDRGATTKPVSSSFKKVPVYSLPLCYIYIYVCVCVCKRKTPKRRKKDELFWTSSEASDSTKEKKWTSKQPTPLPVLSPGDSYSTHRKYVHTRVKRKFDDKFSSLSYIFPPSVSNEYCFLSLYVFSSQESFPKEFDGVFSPYVDCAHVSERDESHQLIVLFPIKITGTFIRLIKLYYVLNMFILQKTKMKDKSIVLFLLF